ncbi:MAG TPA: hypothetical protein ENN77_02510 [Candidatus Wirthbacteria bacterium]|nr:hypothetical protein [Candidatus Wirthbacteria bacterium]
MSKSNKIVLICLVMIVAVGALFYLTRPGSDQSTEQKSTQLANHTLQELSEVDSARLDFKFEIESLPISTQNNLTGYLSGNYRFDFKKDPNPVSIINLSADLETNEGKITFEDLTLLSQAQEMLVRLQSLNTTMPVIQDISQNLDSIAGKWFSLPETSRTLANLPYEQSAEAQALLSELGIYDLDPTRLQTMLKDNEIFTQLASRSEETINNIDTTRYSFSQLDPSGTAQFLGQFLSILGSYNQTQLQGLEQELQLANLTGDIWISKEAGLIERIQLDVRGDQQTNPALQLKFEVNLTEINQAITIEEASPVNRIEDYLTDLTGFPSLAPVENPDEIINDLSPSDQLPELN